MRAVPHFDAVHNCSVLIKPSFLARKNPSMKSVLFITKKGQEYSDSYGVAYTSSGLLNSAKFVVDMLKTHDVNAALVTVNDNNDIDREVAKYNPDVVIIEALWVVPEKLSILTRLHPNVKWVVRVHSEVPFLAQEGIAIQWLFDYLKQDNVYVSFNSLRALHDFMRVSWSNRLLYLPNYFPVKKEVHKDIKSGIINIGCFGAIRPLKNQLIQALSAIRFADLESKILRFHMNTARVEGGHEVLKNIRALFANTGHILVEHGWLHHHRFQHLLSHMDLSMCVSFSETFCLVAADSVSMRVPLVCSPEVHWSSKLSQAEPTSMDSIVDAMYRVLRYKRLTGFLNRSGLKEYDLRSTEVWLQFLK